MSGFGKLNVRPAKAPASAGGFGAFAARPRPAPPAPPASPAAKGRAWPDDTLGILSRIQAHQGTGKKFGANHEGLPRATIDRLVTEQLVQEVFMSGKLVTAKTPRKKFPTLLVTTEAGDAIVAAASAPAGFGAFTPRVRPAGPPAAAGAGFGTFTPRARPVPPPPAEGPVSQRPASLARPAPSVHPAPPVRDSESRERLVAFLRDRAEAARRLGAIGKGTASYLHRIATDIIDRGKTAQQRWEILHNASIHVNADAGGRALFGKYNADLGEEFNRWRGAAPAQPARIAVAQYIEAMASLLTGAMKPRTAGLLRASAEQLRERLMDVPADRYRSFAAEYLRNVAEEEEEQHEPVATQMREVAAKLQAKGYERGIPAEAAGARPPEDIPPEYTRIVDAAQRRPVPARTPSIGALHDLVGSWIGAKRADAALRRMPAGWYQDHVQTLNLRNELQHLLGKYTTTAPGLVVGAGYIGDQAVKVVQRLAAEDAARAQAAGPAPASRAPASRAPTSSGFAALVVSPAPSARAPTSTALARPLAGSVPISGRLTVLQRAIDAAQNLTGLALTRAEGARSRVGRTEAALAVRVAVTSWGAASREGADVAGVEGALKALAGALDRNADVPEALATAQAAVHDFGSPSTAAPLPSVRAPAPSVRAKPREETAEEREIDEGWGEPAPEPGQEPSDERARLARYVGENDVGAAEEMFRRILAGETVVIDAQRDGRIFGKLKTHGQVDASSGTIRITERGASENASLFRKFALVAAPEPAPAETGLRGRIVAFLRENPASQMLVIARAVGGPDEASQGAVLKELRAMRSAGVLCHEPKEGGGKVCSLKGPPVATAAPPSGPLVTTKLPDGTEVLGTPTGPGEPPLARSYTKQSVAVARVEALGEGWDVIRRGRHFYVRKLAGGMPVEMPATTDVSTPQKAADVIRAKLAPLFAGHYLSVGAERGVGIIVAKTAPPLGMAIPASSQPYTMSIAPSQFATNVQWRDLTVKFTGSDDRKEALEAAGLQVIRRSSDMTPEQAVAKVLAWPGWETLVRIYGGAAEAKPAGDTRPLHKIAFVEVKKNLLSGLRDRGWEVQADLRTPWAEKDGTRLWFEERAIYLGTSSKRGDAHSISSDMRADFATAPDPVEALLAAVARYQGATTMVGAASIESASKHPKWAAIRDALQDKGPEAERIAAELVDEPNRDVQRRLRLDVAHAAMMHHQADLEAAGLTVGNALAKVIARWIAEGTPTFQDLEGWIAEANRAPAEPFAPASERLDVGDYVELKRPIEGLDESGVVVERRARDGSVIVEGADGERTAFTRPEQWRKRPEPPIVRPAAPAWDPARKEANLRPGMRFILERGAHEFKRTFLSMEARAPRPPPPQKRRKKGEPPPPPPPPPATLWNFVFRIDDKGPKYGTLDRFDETAARWAPRGFTLIKGGEAYVFGLDESEAAPLSIGSWRATLAEEHRKERDRAVSEHKEDTRAWLDHVRNIYRTAEGRAEAKALRDLEDAKALYEAPSARALDPLRLGRLIEATEGDDSFEGIHDLLVEAREKGAHGAPSGQAALFVEATAIGHELGRLNKIKFDPLRESVRKAVANLRMHIAKTGPAYEKARTALKEALEAYKARRPAKAPVLPPAEKHAAVLVEHQAEALSQKLDEKTPCATEEGVLAATAGEYRTLAEVSGMLGGCDPEMVQQVLAKLSGDFKVRETFGEGKPKRWGHDVPPHREDWAVHRDGAEIYGDTSFLTASGQLPGFSARHIGMGEFVLDTPKGEVEFDRMRGKDFPGQTGRSHLLYAQKPEALALLLEKMHVDERLAQVAAAAPVAPPIAPAVAEPARAEAPPAGPLATPGPGLPPVDSLDALKRLRKGTRLYLVARGGKAESPSARILEQMRLHEMGLKVDDPRRKDNGELSWVMLPEGTRVRGTERGFKTVLPSGEEGWEFSFSETAPSAAPDRSQVVAFLEKSGGAPLEEIVERVGGSFEEAREQVRHLLAELVRESVVGPVDEYGRTVYRLRPARAARMPEGKAPKPLSRAPLHQEGKDLYGDTEFWAWLGRTYQQHTPFGAATFNISGPFGQIDGENAAVVWPGMFGKAYKIKAAAGYRPEETGAVMAAFRAATNVDGVLAGAPLGAPARSQAAAGAPAASSPPRLSVAEKAAELWAAFTPNERVGVAVGMFPAKPMQAAEKEGYGGRDLSVALMQHAEQQKSAASPRTVSREESDDIIRTGRDRGDMIHAIKRYRELTGTGLAEARHAVEAMIAAAPSAPSASRAAATPGKAAEAASAVAPSAVLEVAAARAGVPGAATPPSVAVAEELEAVYTEGTPEEHHQAAARRTANLKAMWTAYELNEHPRPPTPTPAELLTMGAYSGWGGLGTREGETSSFDEQVKKMPPGFAAEARGLIHESYTPSRLCAEVGRFLMPYFPALAEAGGGKIDALEPAGGIGRFVRTLEGPGYELVKWHVVEYSHVSASLLRAMRPDLDLFEGPFEQWVAENEDTWRGRFQLVVSNPPYGKRGAARNEDTQHEYAGYAKNWEYFLRRSLDLLAKDGIGVFLIPAGFMTSKTKPLTELRLQVLLRHHLMAAFRLPSDLFPQNEVSVDLIFFRSRGGRLKSIDEADKSLLEGEYYVEHPSHVLGTVATGGRWGGGYQIVGEFTGLPEFTERPLCGTCVHAPIEPAKVAPRPKAKASALAGSPARLKVASGLGNRLAIFLAGVAAQQSETPLLAWEELHRALGDWSATYGPPSDDKDLQKLATIDKDPGVQKFLTGFVKGSRDLVPALRKRPGWEPSYTGPKNDAVAWAYHLYQRHRVLHRSEVTADVERLFRAGWCEDEPGELVPPEVYFTGDLWAKYDRAKERAAEGDPQAAAQVGLLLEEIKPAVFDDIARDAFSPQQAWIPLPLIECWIETLAKVGTVHLERRDGLVQEVGKDFNDVEGGWHNDVSNVLGWINHDRSNFRPQKRSREENIDVARVEKADEWTKNFKAWCSATEGRKQIIEQTYQRMFQGYRPATYGVDPVPLARWGANVVPRPHQNKAARRLIANRGGLAALDVGVGKTFTGCLTLAAARQEGWAKRPVIVVPNSIVWNWVAEMAKALPDYRVGVIGATRKILVTGRNKGKYTSETDEPEERAAKWAQFQAGEFDVMLVTYTSFGRTKMSKDDIEDYVDQTAALQRHLALRRRNASKGNRSDKPGKADKATSRETGTLTAAGEILKKGKGLTELDEIKLKESTAGWVAAKLQLPPKQKYDPGLTWDDLAIDFLMVDEAQNFKNKYKPDPREFGIPAFMGSGGEGSDRAWQLDFRAMTVRRRNGGTGVVLLSATPAKNSPLEYYSLLTYIDHDAFARMGIEDPEQFIDRYCRLETQVVVDMIGNAKEKSACVGFMNLHELRSTIFRYGEFATADEVEKMGAPARHAAWLELTDRYKAPPEEIARVWGWGLADVKKGIQAARSLVPEVRPEDEVDAVDSTPADQRPRLKAAARHTCLSNQKLGDGKSWLQVLKGVCDRTGYPLAMGLDEGLKLPKPIVHQVQLEGDDAQTAKRLDYVKQIEKMLKNPGKGSPLGLLALLSLVGIHANLDDRKLGGIDEETGRQLYEPFWDWENAESVSSPHSPKFDAIRDRILERRDCGHIVFIESIAAHVWLRMVLIEAGIPKDRIAILNADTHNPDRSPDARQRIANEFNGSPAVTYTDMSGVETFFPEVLPKYDVIIANQVAYEGLNLQTRTCAIHHGDLPWEPATVQQRNGRGWRQGNAFGAIAIYYYLSACFPDSMKFAMIQGKRNWMGDLIQGQARETNNPGAQMKVGPEEVLAMIACDPEKARKLFAALEEKRKRERDAKVAADASQKLRVASNFFAMARASEARRAGDDEGAAPPAETDTPTGPEIDRCGNAPRTSEQDPSRSARFRAEGEQRLNDVLHVDPAVWPWGEWAVECRDHAMLVRVPSSKLMQGGDAKTFSAPDEAEDLEQEEADEPSSRSRGARGGSEGGAKPNAAPVMIFEKVVSPLYESLRTKTPDFRDSRVLNYDEFGRVRFGNGGAIGMRPAGQVAWKVVKLDEIAKLDFRPENRIKDPADWPADDDARMDVIMRRDILPQLNRTYYAEKHLREMNWVDATEGFLVKMWGRYGAEITAQLNQLDNRLSLDAQKIEIPGVLRGNLTIGVTRKVDSILPPTEAGFQEFLRLAPYSDERYETMRHCAAYWWERNIPNNLLSAATDEQKAARAALQKDKARREREEKEAAELAEREAEAMRAAEEEQRRRERAERVDRERRELEARRAQARVERTEHERELLRDNPNATLKLTSPKTKDAYYRERLRELGGFPQSEGFGSKKTWVWHVPLAKADEARRILGEE